ncbi:MAG: 1-deoxy-D-xylulose-5-phosphate synthase [Clostridia bacterium]|nr:1-deoxy-D-xylulose-5-phosphate synthase [Clostridia bacterium]
MLESIHSPRDLDKLSYEQLESLAGEIRNELITTVSANGGHLASNLGIVELTLALHRVFHMPEDRIVFDVGHQSYVHKMVTGRYDRFSTLRSYGGISGFPKRCESEYDCFETGHASTAISAALGMARARDYRKEQYEVIAVVGDGALTGGMCYEALNDAGNSGTKMIVILNDNEMSIAPNVGALSNYLTNLRISAGWQSAKRKVRHLNSIPVIGRPLYRMIHGAKKLIRTVLLRYSELGFFEALGFSYFGPISGHDLAGMENAFRQAQMYKGPCVIHVLTKKGYGYDKAEERPEAFHGTPPFYIETGNRVDKPDRPSLGHVMADTLADMTEKDPRIVAITAAMKLGTGLDHFAEKFPDRLIDVGIAEEHAATMAAGLAAGGMRPYVAVYASFFQRCYDQMLHDVCMQQLPVTFLLDRSGIGGEDGQTHHGLFDLSMTIPVPGLTVLAPCSSEELVSMLRWTAGQDGPCVIRYPKSLGTFETDLPYLPFTVGTWHALNEMSGVILLATGSMTARAVRARDILGKQGIAAAVVNCSTVKPLDEQFLASVPETAKVFTLEEHMLNGGFGAYVSQTCLSRGWTVPVRCFGVEDTFIQHGDHEHLMQDAGLSAEQIAEKIAADVKGEGTLG